MNVLKFLGWVLLILFIIGQFFKPQKNEGTYNLQSFFKETDASAKEQTLLFNACADCHSNVTNYPWYNQITPVNFWLAHHIKEGKEGLNFSNWNSYSNKKKVHKLEECIEMIEKKEMPLSSYTWTHNESKLTTSQIQTLINWATKAKQKIAEN